MRVNFHKGLFGVISLLKSKTLLCWNNLIKPGLICVWLILSGLLCDIQCWIWTKRSFRINF